MFGGMPMKNGEIIMKTEDMTQRDVHRRWGFEAGTGVRTFLAVAVALLMALATALPADAQARRTRPPENKGSSGSTSSASPPPSPPPAARSGSSGGQQPSSVRGSSPRDRGGPAVRTRPETGSSPQVIENDRRDHRYRGHRPFRGYRGGYYPYRGYHSYGWNPYRYSWHLGFGYWGWYDWHNPYPYHAYPHTYYDYRPGHYGPYRVPYYASQVRETMGALDLDLKPGDTQIYLDGHHIGTADNFDGWPQYLWLDQGDYHFVFYAEGRRTIAREYKILPGVVIDVEDRLEHGESTPPEELFPVPTERRDERLAKNAEMRARAEAEARAEADWRRRSEEIRQRSGDWGDDPGYETPAGDFGSLQLTVTPPDASVYLDGRFLGTAADLMRLSRGLTIDTGHHDLSIVRPGHEGEEIRFEVESGEVVELDIELQRN